MNDCPVRPANASSTASNHTSKRGATGLDTQHRRGKRLQGLRHSRNAGFWRPTAPTVHGSGGAWLRRCSVSQNAVAPRRGFSTPAATGCQDLGSNCGKCAIRPQQCKYMCVNGRQRTNRAMQLPEIAHLAREAAHRLNGRGACPHLRAGSIAPTRDVRGPAVRLPRAAQPVYSFDGARSHEWLCSPTQATLERSDSETSGQLGKACVLRPVGGPLAPPAHVTQTGRKSLWRKAPK